MDPVTFATNMLLILAGVFALGFLFVFVVSTWTGIRVVVFLRRQRRAESLWKKVSRRADGKRYPTQVEGVCGECGRGGRFIYCPEDSEKSLCPGCYEEFWRRVEGYVDPAEADRAVEPRAHQC